MAAMLVAIALLSVVMMVALPTWSHQARREKEAELVFRGEQYARAIGLYQRKMAGAFPPSIDVLVEQKFLRRKYKDPITDDDFAPVFANSPQAMAMMQPQGAQGPQGTGSSVTMQVTTADGRRQATATFQAGMQGQSGAPRAGGPGGPAGIIGVVSRSKEKSIRLYNGRDQYDQWIFVYSLNQPMAGAPAPGTPPPAALGPPRGGGPAPSSPRGGRGPF